MTPARGVLPFFAIWWAYARTSRRDDPQGRGIMKSSVVTHSVPRRGRLALAAFLAVFAVIGTAPAAYAANPATVMEDTQRMTSSNLTQGAIQYGLYKQGKLLTLVCYVRGESVWGHYSPYGVGRDNLWYQVDDGYWVADVDINTGSNSAITGPCPTINTSTYYMLTNRNSGRAIDVRGGAAAAGAALQQYTINRTPAQQFKFTPSGAGYYKVTSLITDSQAWDAQGGQSANGTKLQTWSWGAGANQQWRPVWDASGNATFRPRHADYQCVDVPGGSTLNSVQLQLYGCNWTNAQKFSMTTVTQSVSKVDQFVTNNTGKVLSTPEGTFAGQCVSLARQYLWQVYGILGGAWGDAVAYRSGGTAEVRWQRTGSSGPPTRTSSTATSSCGETTPAR